MPRMFTADDGRNTVHCTPSAGAADTAAMLALQTDATMRCGKASLVVVVVAIVVVVFVVVVIGTGEAREPESTACAADGFRVQLVWRPRPIRDVQRIGPQWRPNAYVFAKVGDAAALLR